MKYDISKGIAPKMPNLKKGLEVLKLITGQVSPDMRQAVVPTLFPSLAAHVSNTYFQYSSNAYVELCGTMSHLCGVTGIGKGQMDLCVKAICRDLVEHDQKELAKVAAQKQDDQTKGKKKGKKAEEDNLHTSICLFYPPCDVTNPAFKLNAKACEDAGNRSQYYKLPEIEMADSMCGSHRLLRLLRPSRPKPRLKRSKFVPIAQKKPRKFGAYRKSTYLCSQILSVCLL